MKKIVFSAMLLCLSMFVFACGKKAETETDSAMAVTDSREEEQKEDIQKQEIQGEEEEKLQSKKNQGEEDENEPVRETGSYIPETLLKFLEDQTGRENEEMIENISPLTIDRVLGEEELVTYMDNPDVQICAERIDESGGKFLLVDGDNDGIDDLFAWINDGGSMGNNSRVFLQGQKDGSFLKTFETGDITQELIFIEHEGKNYLLETTYDYNRKCVDGFQVSCYENGICREEAKVYVENSYYEGNIVEADEDYRTLAEKVIQMGKNGFMKEYSYDWVMDAGNCEKQDDLPEEIQTASGREKGYHSDINNDGNDEWYIKFIFYPSTVYTCMYMQDSLYFSGNTEGKELLSCYNLEYEGMPLTFWVEHVEETDKQIVCLLCYDGLSRNVVYGFLIEGEKVTKVMEIDFRGNEKIVYEIES